MSKYQGKHLRILQYISIDLYNVLWRYADEKENCNIKYRKLEMDNLHLIELFSREYDMISPQLGEPWTLQAKFNSRLHDKNQ